MRALDVNLASQPFRNNTLLWVVYGTGFALVLGFLSWNVMTWLDLRGSQRETAQRLQEIDDQLADLDRREVIARREQGKDEYDVLALTVQAVAANEVIDRKAFSWTRLFNGMEETIPWNVHLTSIRPLFRGSREGGAPQGPGDRKSVLIAVEGYSKNLSAFLDFETALIDHVSFDFPEPRRHQLNERNEVVFELDFSYYPEDSDALLEAVDDGSATDTAIVDDAETPGLDAADAVDDGAVEGTPVEGVPVTPAAEPDPEALTIADTGDAAADDAPADDRPADGTAGATPEDGAVTTTEVAAEPSDPGPGEAQAAPQTTRGQQPPRIPPRPYAQEPKKSDAADAGKAKTDTKRKPPRRRKDDEDDS